MSHGTYLQLEDCSEFRQTLEARAPRLVHGTAILLILLMLTASLWAAIVKADLVIRAPGRVRPTQLTTRIFVASAADVSGRVTTGSIREGDTVHAGDLLVRLDTVRVENEIAKRQRSLSATEEELTNLDRVRVSLNEQHVAARAKGTAELELAEATLKLTTQRAASEQRRCEVETKTAEESLRRLNELWKSNSISKQELEAGEEKLHQAKEKLFQAALPIDASAVAVARSSLDTIDRDFAVKSSELDARVAVKKGEADSARSDLANLILQRNAAEIRSPIDGVVVSGKVQPGDVLEVGKPILEIAQSHDCCFEARVRNEDVGDLRQGMLTHIKLNAYDYQKFGVLRGKVVYISPDSTQMAEKESSDEAKPSTRDRAASAGFVVRIAVDSESVGDADHRPSIKLGLDGTAEIVTGTESVLSILLHRIRHSISMG